jgi:cold shock CspA family protein
LETKNVFFGTASRFNKARAFGFILSDSPIDRIADKEIYFHRTDMPRGVEELTPGQRVEFRTIRPHIVGKPPQAKIIRIVEVSEAA